MQVHFPFVLGPPRIHAQNKSQQIQNVLLTHPALEIGTVLFMVSKRVHLDSNIKQTRANRIYIYVCVCVCVCVCDLKKTEE